MLNKPNSICVSGQFVYVTNSGGCYVSVFTTTEITSLHLVAMIMNSVILVVLLWIVIISYLLLILMV